MIKSGVKLTTDSIGAEIKVNYIESQFVSLSIYSQAFRAADLKELRKFLKKIQKQLEVQEGSDD